MDTNRTFTLAQLDALCHALDDYLALTVDEHFELHKGMTTEFKSVRDRLMANYTPIEARVYAMKVMQQIPITIE